MSKYTVTIEFDERYHGVLFESWMSNLGEQLYWRQLDVEKEIGEVPKKLSKALPVFHYPKRGFITVTSEDEDE